MIPSAVMRSVQVLRLSMSFTAHCYGGLQLGLERGCFCRGLAEGGAPSVPHSNRRDEAITARRHSLDHSAGVASPVQGLAQGRAIDGQVHFLDEGVGLYLAQQIILGDQMPGVTDQHNEHIEALGVRGTGSPAEQQTFLCARMTSPNSKIWSFRARITQASEISRKNLRHFQRHHLWHRSQSSATDPTNHHEGSEHEYPGNQQDAPSHPRSRGERLHRVRGAIAHFDDNQNLPLRHLRTR
jgi:hypothetical protein